jgi:hypothetical protein
MYFQEKSTTSGKGELNRKRKRELTTVEGKE